MQLIWSLQYTLDPSSQNEKQIKWRNKTRRPADYVTLGNVCWIPEGNMILRLEGFYPQA